MNFLKSSEDWILQGWEDEEEQSIMMGGEPKMIEKEQSIMLGENQDWEQCSESQVKEVFPKEGTEA